jgi:hypothetical protein
LKDRLECEPNRRIKASDNAAFGAEPQGYGQGRDSLIDRQEGSDVSRFGQPWVSKPFQCGGIVATDSCFDAFSSREPVSTPHQGRLT